MRVRIISTDYGRIEFSRPRPIKEAREIYDQFIKEQCTTSSMIACLKEKR